MDLNLRSFTVTTNMDSYQPEKIVILEDNPEDGVQVYELPMGAVSGKTYRMNIKPSEHIARNWTAVKSVKTETDDEHLDKVCLCLFCKSGAIHKYRATY